MLSQLGTDLLKCPQDFAQCDLNELEQSPAAIDYSVPSKLVLASI